MSNVCSRKAPPGLASGAICSEGNFFAGGLSAEGLLRCVRLIELLGAEDGDRLDAELLGLGAEVAVAKLNFTAAYPEAGDANACPASGLAEFQELRGERAVAVIGGDDAVDGEVNALLLAIHAFANAVGEDGCDLELGVGVAGFEGLDGLEEASEDDLIVRSGIAVAGVELRFELGDASFEVGLGVGGGCHVV